MMARVKVTSSDINARLAKGECANFRNGCQGRLPCAVINGEACKYFDDYVRPLLDTSEFAQRYAREAKVKLALDPNAKVVRKRRQAGTPALDIAAAPVQPMKQPGARANAPAVPAKSVKKTPPQTVKPAATLKLAVDPMPIPAARKAREKTPVVSVSLPEIVQPRAAAMPKDQTRPQADVHPAAKPNAGPALQLEVKPEAETKHVAAMPKSAASAPSPSPTAKITPAKQTPPAKQTVTTPQLELFPME